MGHEHHSDSDETGTRYFCFDLRPLKVATPRLLGALYSWNAIGFRQAGYRQARDAVAHAQMQLAGFSRGDGRDATHIAPEALRDWEAEIQRLECEERDTATRFNAISDELAQLHRRKYGEWHITWRGPPGSR